LEGEEEAAATSTADTGMILGAIAIVLSVAAIAMQFRRKK
jgi:hypothetical protein